MKWTREVTWTTYRQDWKITIVHRADQTLPLAYYWLVINRLDEAEGVPSNCLGSSRSLTEAKSHALEACAKLRLAADIRQRAG